MVTNAVLTPNNGGVTINIDQGDGRTRSTNYPFPSISGFLEVTDRGGWAFVLRPTDNTAFELIRNASRVDDRGYGISILGTTDPQASNTAFQNALTAGQGGSRISQWPPTASEAYHSILAARYNAAKAAIPGRVKPVLIWWQGINDANDGNTANWRANTEAQFVRVRTLMGAKTPIFAMKIMPNTANKSKLMDCSMTLPVVIRLRIRSMFPLLTMIWF